MYSALDGYGTPEEMVVRAKEVGMESLAITDHGTCAGWLSHRNACAKHEVRPIFGIEAYHAKNHRTQRPGRGARDGAHLLLLAENQQGYRNILRLSDEANRTGFYYNPRVDWELLEKYKEGIICTSACMSGLVSEGIREDTTEYLNRYLEIFRENFFIELHTYEDDEQVSLNKELMSIAHTRGLPVVYATDAHFPSADQHEEHETLIAMQYNKMVNMEHPYHPNCLYIMDEPEVRAHLHYLPSKLVSEAIDNSDAIASRCNYDKYKPGQHLPKFSGRGFDNNNLALVSLVEDGLYERYGDITEEIEQRAAYELSSIIDAGLADYFLIVWDFIEWCRVNDIMKGPSRGSAGSSLLAYAMGITEIDPIKYDLYFERFWNPGRTKGLPDIDIDIESARKDDVKGYMIQKYGKDRVLSIGSYSKIGPKSAVRKVMTATKGKDTNFAELKKISDIIETTTDAGLVADWEDIYKVDELQEYINRYPDIFALAGEYIGRIATYSTHASGVVVSDVDLPDVLPCRQDSKEKVLVTQVDMREVEEQGFAKFDLLGLTTLDILKNTIRLAGEEDFEFKDVPYDTLADSFWQQCDKGHTIGLFQIEDGQGARQIAKDVQPRSIMDLALIIGLNRPGPLRSGDTARYLKRRKGAEVKYLHPILEPILERTLGVFLFQEQVTALFTAIGYDLSEADEIRKIMGKKKVEDMLAQKPRYMERSAAYMSEASAEEIWESIVNYSKYGFNLGHSVGYGTLLAWTMYAKWKWPTEFIMASIMSVPKEKKQIKIPKIINEARRMGIAISLPDVNMSGAAIRQVDDTIYFGLQDVKGLGKLAAQWVIDHRPYESYEHFMERHQDEQRIWDESDKKRSSPSQTLRSNQIAALYDAGAFDSLGGRQGLVDEDKAAQEKELLGLALTDVITPIVERNRQAMDQLDPYSRLDDDDYAQVPGVVVEVRESKIRPDAHWNPGEKFAFVSIEWKGESTSFVAFTDEYKKFKYMLSPNVVGRFDLRVGGKGPVMVGGTRYL